MSQATNSHSHATEHVEETEHHDTEGGGSKSERYELEDLFQGEAAENQHFLKVLGIVVLVVLLVLALAYPLFMDPGILHRIWGSVR